MQPLLTPSRKRHVIAVLLAVAAHILVLAAGEGLWQLALHTRQPRMAARQSSSLLVSLSLAPEAASAEQTPAESTAKAARPSSTSAAGVAAAAEAAGEKAALSEPVAAPVTAAQNTAESLAVPLASGTDTELQLAINPAPDAASSTGEDMQVESSGSSPRYSAAAGGATSAAAIQGELLSWLHGELARSLVYPAIARRRGLEGRVELSLAINADGSLQLAQLRSSSGHRILDVAALDFLRDLFPSPLAPGADIQLPVQVEWRLED